MMKFQRSIIERLAVWRARHLTKSEQGVAQYELSQESAEHYIVWEEPNRAHTPELQIGRSGGRYSTLTGVWWLDEDKFIVNHRSGLRMAVFDLSVPCEPIWKAEIAHLTDDIAAKVLSPNIWEIAVSGCWDCIYSRYRLELFSTFSVAELEVLHHKNKDFCHGVAYDAMGNLCSTIHTGKEPRIQIGNKINKLPAPWGARDICHDPARKRYIAVAVSANPQRKAYGGVKTSIWICPEASINWECLGVYDNVHADAVDIWNGCIWIPDQVGNRLLAVNSKSGELELVCSGNALDFPHGLGISENGKIAVTNYGTSSVVIVDADALLG